MRLAHRTLCVHSSRPQHSFCSFEFCVTRPACIARRHSFYCGMVRADGCVGWRGRHAIHTRQAADAGASVFAQLNAACVGEVVVVHVAAGVRCAAPVHVLSLATSSAGELSSCRCTPYHIASLPVGSRTRRRNAGEKRAVGRMRQASGACCPGHWQLWPHQATVCACLI
jgi:hypothetical protein